MCWADKIGLAWAGIFGLFIYLAHDMPNVGPYTYFVLEMVFAFPVWVALRLIDWIIGGPARRRGVVTVRPY